VSTPTITAEVTKAIRVLGATADARLRALGSTVRQLVRLAGVSEPPSLGGAQNADLVPAQFLDWIAFALRHSASLLVSESDECQAEDAMTTGEFVIVDRLTTRC
jgi:hypothetical protein